MLDAFLGDAGVRYSIIEAIANGEHTWSGITSRLGKQPGSLSRPMHWLVNMEFVAPVVPITECRPETSKQALYRIRDPYVAFWHRFLSPLVSRGVLGLFPPERLWAVDVGPGLNAYMGSVFEQVCREFAQLPGTLPFEVHRTGRWWDGTSQNQVDVVALGSEGDVLLASANGVRSRGMISGRYGDVPIWSYRTDRRSTHSSGALFRPTISTLPR